MELMPSVKKDYTERWMDLAMPVGFMMGDHTYFRNTSESDWAMNLLERAAIAIILTNAEVNNECRHICCFKLRHKYSPIFPWKRPSQTFFHSYNEDFFSNSRLNIEHVQSYYDWYAQLPMEQTITLCGGLKASLVKFASSESREKIDGAVYENVHYGFEISYEQSVADSLIKAAQDFSNRLLLRHSTLIQRYVSLITKYQLETAKYFRSFSEFEYHATYPMRLLIDPTGVYPRYDYMNGTAISGDAQRDVLPNECQLQQMGFPPLTLIQQFGMGMAIRSMLEKNVAQMYDGTLIRNTFSLRYEVLEFYPNGSNGFDTGHRYIGWVAAVHSVPAEAKKQNSW